MPALIPALVANPLAAASLGLGLYQTVKSQGSQNAALAAAREPRLSLAAQQDLRTQGTSNIQASLARRGLTDSSLLPGGLAQLEGRIGEAASAAGPSGDVAGLLARQALGEGQSGSETLGNLAQYYMLKKLFPQGATPPTPAAPPSPAATVANPWGSGLTGSFPMWGQPSSSNPFPPQATQGTPTIPNWWGVPPLD